MSYIPDSRYEMQFRLAFHKITPHEVNRANNQRKSQFVDAVYSSLGSGSSDTSRCGSHSASRIASTNNSYWCSNGIF
jgi:hypothetical protein